MKTVVAPVRNFSARPQGAVISSIVIHDTATLSVESVVATFDDPDSRASAHATVDRGGTVYLHVNEAAKAWHAGRSSLWGVEDLNAISLGYELVDASEDPYPAVQIEALVELVADACVRYRAILLNRIVGHEHIATPYGRKTDPGPDFPWRSFLLRVGHHVYQRTMVPRWWERWA